MFPVVVGGGTVDVVAAPGDAAMAGVLSFEDSVSIGNFLVYIFFLPNSILVNNFVLWLKCEAC